jgi:nitrogenase molybdenum-iron protein alpha chain
MAISKRYMVAAKREYSYSCSMPGVWRAVAHNKGAVVIYHSPRACGHIARQMEVGGYYYAMARQVVEPMQYTAPLITSNLREEHSIFGGADQLRHCLDYVVERYKPEYLMIANSCVAGVIGDDTPAIAREAERDWGIPMLTIPCSGFLDGEYHGGFYHAAKILADRFMEPQPTCADRITLLGDCGGPFGAYAKEIAALLRPFSLEVHCRFPGYASLAEIRRVPASALCLPLGGSPHAYSYMRRLAADLQEKFGIPFLDRDYPVGWRGTKTWLKELGEMVGQEGKIALAEAEQQERLQRQAAPCRAAMQAVKMVLCIGRPLLAFELDWIFEFMDLAGVKPTGVVLFSGLTGEQNEALRQVLNKHTASPIVAEQEGGAMIQAADLLVTTHELEDETKRQLFLPMLPPLGVGGLITLLCKLARLAKRSGQQGGVIYGW